MPNDDSSLDGATISRDVRGRTVNVRSTRRAQVTRRPVRWPLLLAPLMLAGGLIETNERIEDDLVQKALAQGATSAEFSAQDGQICGPGDLTALKRQIKAQTGVEILDRDADCDASSTGQGDLGDIVAGNPDLSTFASLVKAAGLSGELSAGGPLTVFAPTNEAFAAVPSAALAELKADPTALAAVLGRHIAKGRHLAADLETGELETDGGGSIAIEVNDGSVTIGAEGALVTEPDQEASNGVLHGIDTVLLADNGADASGLDAKATYDGAGITLTGTVASEAQRSGLVAAATKAVGGDASKVTDQLTLAGTANASTDALAAGLGTLLGSMPTDLASGTASATDRLTLDGVYLDDAAKARISAAANGASVSADDVNLEPRQQATAADRDRIIAEVNSLFVATTIQFATGSADILPESNALLDDAGAILKRFDLSGLRINIEGHTDADGADAANQALSQARADAVRAAIVARQVDPTALTATGFGETRPVVPNDTPENKAKNRRVQFSAQQ